MILKKNYLFVYLLCLLLVSYSACSVMGVRTTKEPSYKVNLSDGDYELRTYDELIVAVTLMDGKSSEARNIGFRRLFKYISGENKSQQSISMTAPVIEELESTKSGQKISMTSPVFIGEGSKNMAFVLPENFSLESAPVPDDKAVRIEQRPSQRVAVLRFSGRISNRSIKERSKQLFQWIKQQKLKAVSGPVAAGYDPPWTLPSLRRNEIHIEIE